MGKRKKTEERCKEILDVGLNILHNRGITDFTVGKIAEKINVSEAAVYKHFDSKEEIIRGMAEKAFSIGFMEPNNFEYKNPRDLIRKILEELFNRLEGKPEITAILFHDRIFAEYPKVKQLFNEHRMDKMSKLKKFVLMGKESNIFDEDIDEKTFATLFLGSVRFTVMEWRNEDFSYPLTEKVEELADQLSRILESR